MAKAIRHAQSSAKKFGGVAEDYFEIHDFMDSSKGAIADNRHRVLTHNAWFISEVIERCHFANSGEMTPDGRFPTIINSDGRAISVRDIAEQHVLEDFGMRFIPSAQDYIVEMPMAPWMNNIPKSMPPSMKNCHLKMAKVSD